MLETVAERLRQSLYSEELPLVPKSIRITDFVDAFDEEAWQITLALPAPKSLSWNRLSVFRLKRRAIDLFDNIIEGHHMELPGATLAVVTVDETEPVLPETRSSSN